MTEIVEARGRAATTAPAVVSTGGLALFGWLIYEWSAQPFYSLVTTFLFAPYFANGFLDNPVRGQAIWGYAAATAGLCVAVLSPLLGAFADASGHRKPWIIVSLIVFMAGLSLLWLADPGHPERLYWVLAAYVLAAVAAEVTAAFVNAIMPGLVAPEHYGRLSGTSAAIGYLGGLTALVVVAGLLVGDPHSGKTLFGLNPLLALDPASRQGDRLVGPFCALWLLIFALPLLLFTPDRQVSRPDSGLAGLRQTVRELEHHKDIILFLVARMLFTDGLLVMFSFGGIYGATLFGWTAVELGLFGIILIVAAMLGAAIGGVLDDRIGPKAVILIALVIAFLAAAGVVSIDRTHVLFGVPVPQKVEGSGFLASSAERWFLGFTIFVGLVTGPLSASSRSLMARLAPKDRVTQFFGLFAFSGKASSFIAPLLVGVLTAMTGDQRWGLAVVLVFLIAGLVMMTSVRSRREEDGDAVAPTMAEPARRLAGPSKVSDGGGWADTLGWIIVSLLFLSSVVVIALSAALGK
jgi:UMF1 family MFS transporter